MKCLSCNKNEALSTDLICKDCLELNMKADANKLKAAKEQESDLVKSTILQKWRYRVLKDNIPPMCADVDHELKNGYLIKLKELANEDTKLICIIGEDSVASSRTNLSIALLKHLFFKDTSKSFFYYDCMSLCDFRGDNKRLYDIALKDNIVVLDRIHADVGFSKDKLIYLLTHRLFYTKQLTVFISGVAIPNLIKTYSPSLDMMRCCDIKQLIIERKQK